MSGTATLVTAYNIREREYVLDSFLAVKNSRLVAKIAPTVTPRGSCLAGLGNHLLNNHAIAL